MAEQSPVYTRCGNGRCDTFESSVECPRDCGGGCTPGEEECTQGGDRRVCESGAWKTIACLGVCVALDDDTTRCDTGSHVCTIGEVGRSDCNDCSCADTMDGPAWFCTQVGCLNCDRDSTCQSLIGPESYCNDIYGFESGYVAGFCESVESVPPHCIPGVSGDEACAAELGVGATCAYGRCVCQLEVLDQPVDGGP